MTPEEIKARIDAGHYTVVPPELPTAPNYFSFPVHALSDELIARLPGDRREFDEKMKAAREELERYYRGKADSLDELVRDLHDAYSLPSYDVTSNLFATISVALIDGEFTGVKALRRTVVLLEQILEIIRS